MEIISSKDNIILKHCRKLKIKKVRQENKEFLIEGIRFVEEAVLSGVDIKYCLCSNELKGDKVDTLIKTMKDKGIKVYIVEDRMIKEISETQTPQGIIAVVKQKDYNEERLLSNSSYIVLVDRIQDPGNMGTIIRTADAAGVDCVLISGGSVDPYSSKVLRSTMGSIFHIPVVSFPNSSELIDRLKEKGFSVYISSLNASSYYYDEDYKVKTVIVIGNEANGVAENIICKADRLIKIPMPGKAESLNASIAAGIIMFEVARQRMNIDKNG